MRLRKISLLIVSIDEQDDMEEFMEHEEEFEARQSISSRGRDTRVQMMPDNNQPDRKTNQAQQVKNYQHEEQRRFEYAEGEGEESSVITEIVDEQIVELKSEDEEKVDDGINQYLDNIKQEDYVNREEYQEYEDNHDGSPYKQEDMFNHQERKDYKNVKYDQKQDQIDIQNQNYEQADYQNKGMEHSPIVENPMEDELTASPQYYEAPRVINPKYRRKYEGANLNDKSHLIWEQERLQRKRVEREMRAINIWDKPYNSREIDWNPSTNSKKAAFNYAKNPQRSNMWHFSQSSSVPMLSKDGAKKAAAPTTESRSKFDPRETDAKADHTINNIFHQSSLQQLLSGNKSGKVNAPLTHSSLQKEIGKAFMTPSDNRFQNHSNVVEGRARMFHSSQIF